MTEKPWRKTTGAKLIKYDWYASQLLYRDFLSVERLISAAFFIVKIEERVEVTDEARRIISKDFRRDEY